MAKTKKSAKKKTRKKYSMADRARIVAAANAEGLTAAAVETKFGVKPVTYYSWRKKEATGKAGGTRSRGRPARATGLAGAVRAEVQSRVREILPKIIREETDRYLRDVLKG
jgi:transposase-like protein